MAKKLNPKAVVSVVSTDVKGPARTHGGGISTPTNAAELLRRSVNSCLLFEDEFYESGENIADRIKKLTHQVPIDAAIDIAVKAKDSGLRHAPLWVARHLLNHPGLDRGNARSRVQDCVFDVIRRADEIPDFLALYWRDGKTPLSGILKKALERAFDKFTEYQFGKVADKGSVKLRDAMRLVHPVPRDEQKSELYSKILSGTLSIPDTWETRLSSGENKKNVFEDLMKRKKLGALALIRNLRNMEQAGVDRMLVRESIANADFSKVFPYQVIQAAQQSPAHSDALEDTLYSSLDHLPKLEGTTAIIVDISGSMGAALSGKSDMTRRVAAAALATLIQSRCQAHQTYVTAGSDSTRKHATKEIFDRRFELFRKLKDSTYNREVGGGGIFMVQVVQWLEQQLKGRAIERVIVITDEQDCDLHTQTAKVAAKTIGTRGNWIMNVGSSDRGVQYGEGWNHINGFSANIAEYLVQSEAQR